MVVVRSCFVEEVGTGTTESWGLAFAAEGSLSSAVVTGLSFVAAVVGNYCTFAGNCLQTLSLSRL